MPQSVLWLLAVVLSSGLAGVETLGPLTIGAGSSQSFSRPGRAVQLDSVTVLNGGSLSVTASSIHLSAGNLLTNGCAATLRSVANQPPLPAISTSVNGQIVTCSASASTDDGGEMTFSWEFDNGTASTGPVATVTFATLGSHRIRLTAVDTMGTSASTQSWVTITNHNPTINLTTSLSTYQLIASASGTSDPDGDSLTYAWDFGDGSVDTLSSIQHLYTTPGVFTIRLTVQDSRGATASVEKNVSVVPLPTIYAGFGSSSTYVTLSATPDSIRTWVPLGEGRLDQNGRFIVDPNSPEHDIFATTILVNGVAKLIISRAQLSTSSTLLGRGRIHSAGYQVAIPSYFHMDCQFNSRGISAIRSTSWNHNVEYSMLYFGPSTNADDELLLGQGSSELTVWPHLLSYHPSFWTAPFQPSTDCYLSTVSTPPSITSLNMGDPRIDLGAGNQNVIACAGVNRPSASRALVPIGRGRINASNLSFDITSDRSSAPQNVCYGNNFIASAFPVYALRIEAGPDLWTPPGSPAGDYRPARLGPGYISCAFEEHHRRLGGKTSSYRWNFSPSQTATPSTVYSGQFGSTDNPFAGMSLFSNSLATPIQLGNGYIYMNSGTGSGTHGFEFYPTIQPTILSGSG